MIQLLYPIVLHKSVKLFSESSVKVKYSNSNHTNKTAKYILFYFYFFLQCGLLLAVTASESNSLSKFFIIQQNVKFDQFV